LAFWGHAGQIRVCGDGIGKYTCFPLRLGPQKEISDAVKAAFASEKGYWQRKIRGVVKDVIHGR